MVILEHFNKNHIISFHSGWSFKNYLPVRVYRMLPVSNKKEN